MAKRRKRQVEYEGDENGVDSQDPCTVRVYCESGARLPFKKSIGASGYDLESREDVTIEPGEWKLVRTGVYLDMSPGVEAQVRPRSGIALRHGVTVLNAPGTIDSDYRGEVCVMLINHGKKPFDVEQGARIAQIAFSPVYDIKWCQVESRSNLRLTLRGEGGFGSTGV
jgi:dUTP pyrophosphatase